MPFDPRDDEDRSDSRYCGVEIKPEVLSWNLTAGFDFVVAPLIDPNYRPNSAERGGSGISIPPFAASDLVLSPLQWSSRVVGKISTWIDLDWENEQLSEDSEVVLKQEISWASHLSLQACILPPPKGVCFVIILSGRAVDNVPSERLQSQSNGIVEDQLEDGEDHPLKSYLNCVAMHYHIMDPLSVHEKFELGCRDYLQSPLKPLTDNLEAQTNETFEKDTVKCSQYHRAVSKALHDSVPDDKASIITTVLMVVGAGWGPLVRACLQVKSHKDTSHFGTAYEVFMFHHPDLSCKKSNKRYSKLQFLIPEDTGSAMVHGVAGYFDAVLYKDVHIGIEPSMATPDMFSWFAIFFPLRKPIVVPAGLPLQVHFWRCCDATKVWYEWSVTSPFVSPIHNPSGRSYWVGL